MEEAQDIDKTLELGMQAVLQEGGGYLEIGVAEVQLQAIGWLCHDWKN